jgi:hypothetical protein
MNQGTNANKSGQDLERLLEAIMIYHGFEPIHYLDFKNIQENNIEDLFNVSGKFIIRKYPYKTLLGKDGELDRVIYYSGYTVGVECRRQKTNGSVDEKIPHLYENIEKCHPTNESIILVDGTGFSKDALKYIEEKVNERIHLMRIEDLIIWARKKFD